MNLPKFPEAVDQFREFLRTQGEEGHLIWIFREDLFQVTHDSTTIRLPVPAGNLGLTKKVYEQGRARGLAEIAAVARAGDRIAATVWFPKLPEQEVQGWTRGLKLCLRRPFPEAQVVSSELLWKVHKLRPSWRRFQKLDGFIGTRSWAIA